jgi:hypothetical protein
LKNTDWPQPTLDRSRARRREPIEAGDHQENLTQDVRSERIHASGSDDLPTGAMLPQLIVEHAQPRG